MKDDLPFNIQDLPMIDDRAYHLGLTPEEMAKDIIIVGDPERVPFMANEFLDTKEVDRYHRGLRTIT
ncbi:MAG: uridine phosphorylase, partial [Nitrospirota bacterium]